MDIYSKAIGFAMRKHIDQRRKYTNDPYFVHCLAVSQLVMRRTSDADIIAAAMLHDTLEDTETTTDELRKEFGERATRFVIEVTDQYTKAAYPEFNRRS